MSAARVNKTVFRKYANFYDVFYRGKDYKKESTYILQLLKKHLRKKPRSILDLGCGTGEHALCWAAQGITVTGIDRSAYMLGQARDKARKNHFDLQLVKADIREFNLKKTFDVITAMFAVMSYQTTRGDIVAVLRCVRKHLSAGGIFIFDAWFGPGVLADPPGERVKTFRSNGIEVIRTVTSVHKPVQKLVDVHYDIFIIKSNRILHRIKETHSMHYFFRKEVGQFAERTGFRLIDSHPFLRRTESLSAAGWNATFVLKAV